MYQALALSLGDSSVVELLESHAKGFSEEQNELFSFALMLSTTNLPPTGMLAPAGGPPEGESELHRSEPRAAKGTTL